MATKICQSCGQPLRNGNNGSDKDGSPSSSYCSLCYENGAFKDPNMTLEQMGEVYVKALQTMHVPKFLGRLMARAQLPKLQRWRKKSLSHD